MEWDLLIYGPLALLAAVMVLSGIALFFYAVFGGAVACSIWIFVAIRGALRALQHRN